VKIVNHYLGALVLLLLGLQGCATVPGGGNVYTPPDKGNYPAVIIFHSKGGLSSHEENYARLLSKQGYITMTVNMFGGGGTNITDGYEHLIRNPNVDPNRVGLIGFSQGARAALNFGSRLSIMRSEFQISAIVSFYVGNALVPWIQSIKHPPVLFLHGDQDRELQPAEITNYCKIQRESGTICEYHIYEGAKHAFDRQSVYGGKNIKVTKDARQRALTFLDKYVKRIQDK